MERMGGPLLLPIKEGSSMSLRVTSGKPVPHEPPSGRRDLTVDIEAAPHGPEVLDRYPQVVPSRQRTVRPTAARILERLLERFPILRRHPHPWSFTSRSSLPSRRSSSTCSTGSPRGGVRGNRVPLPGAGLLFCVPAILTGFFTCG